MSIPGEIARHVEWTLFHPAATSRDIERLCTEARENHFHSVCVNGSRVELARSFLEDSGIQAVALVAFPLGAADTDAKRYETEIAIDNGAHEIDFVINLGKLKDGDRNFVLREMRDIVEAADERPVKAVLESSLLTREEKILACQLALDAGVRFVATSTDLQSPATTVDDVKLLGEALGEDVGVKAAGGIRDLETAAALIAAGAKRIAILAGTPFAADG